MGQTQESWLTSRSKLKTVSKLHSLFLTKTWDTTIDAYGGNSGIWGLRTMALSTSQTILSDTLCQPVSLIHPHTACCRGLSHYTKHSWKLLPRKWVPFLTASPTMGVKGWNHPESHKNNFLAFTNEVPLETKGSSIFQKNLFLEKMFGEPLLQTWCSKIFLSDLDPHRN